MLDLGENTEQDISVRLVENALEDCVSAFDGFGRELYQVYGHHALNSVTANKLHFQNLDNIREKVQKAYGIVFASLPNEQKSFVVSAVIALIIRTIESETYYRFVRGDADDVEVVDALFNKPWTKGVQQEFNGCLVEAMIIVGRKELSRNLRIKYRNTDSPLLTNYKNLLKEGESHKEFSHAKNVIDWVQKLSRFGANQVGFDYSVKRIELLSPAFIEQPEEVI